MSNARTAAIISTDERKLREEADRAYAYAASVYTNFVEAPPVEWYAAIERGNMLDAMADRL